MVFRQRAQFAGVKGGIGRADAGQRHRFDKHMGRFDNNAAQVRRLLRGMDQGDAAAIGMADHDMVLPRDQAIEHFGQFAQRVIVHIMQAARRLQRRRQAIAEPVIQQAAATGGLA